MGRRGGKGGGGGKKWSRKRKAEEAEAKAGKPRANGGGGGYNVIQNSNAKFEAYYSLVGLHDARYHAERREFVACVGDAEKHAERDRFMAAMGAILPASFRVDRSLDPTIQRKLLEELQQFVGEEMEVEIELPRRSAAFGGMKNIMEKGKEVADSEAGEAKAEGAAAPGKETSANDDDGPTIVKRKIAPAKPIPFISSNSVTLGYQLSVDRRTLRRNKSLEPLHAWLKIQTDCGHITRQVSRPAAVAVPPTLARPHRAPARPPGNREHDPARGAERRRGPEHPRPVRRPREQDVPAAGGGGGPADRRRGGERGGVRARRLRRGQRRRSQARVHARVPAAPHEQPGRPRHRVRRPALSDPGRQVRSRDGPGGHVRPRPRRRPVFR